MRVAAGGVITDTEVRDGSGSADSEGSAVCDEPAASTVAFVGLMGVAGMERWRYQAKTGFQPC